MTLLDRLQSPGPKRILALDGGGIRGVLTLGFLEQIEQILRQRHNAPDLVLADYFDLIGGTSTGSIIAAALATGKDVATLKELYLQLGGRVFGKKSWLGPLVARFDEAALIKELSEMFGDCTLGGESIRTGLCVVAKRADTRSVWPLINHPEGKFYGENKDILLRRAIRASTAAPTYFKPEKIDVGRGQYAAFVDGGVSMANNPALQLFLVATLTGFPFHWRTGEDDLLLVSIGTGVWRARRNVDDVMDDWLKDWASNVPDMLMEDASWQNQLLLQYFSRHNETHLSINSEVEDLAKDMIAPDPVLTYLRYNAWLDESGLNGLGLGALVAKLDKPEGLREMSAAENRFDLATIGEKAAQRQVKADHFPKAFDLKK